MSLHDGSTVTADPYPRAKKKIAKKPNANSTAAEGEYLGGVGTGEGRGGNAGPPSSNQMCVGHAVAPIYFGFC